ncbi:MAG: HlyD family secretion protein [bacterium]|nr:HlyD family secretion protein [bacterium]
MDISTTREPAARRQIRFYLLVGLPFALLIGLYFLLPTLQYQFSHVITDDAFLDAPLLSLSPSVAGRISDLTIAEGDTVSTDQIISRLSQGLYRAALAETEARVEIAQSGLEERKLALRLEERKTGPLSKRDRAELIAWQARLQGVRAELSEAEGALRRAQQLSKSALVSDSDLETVRLRRDRAQAELQVIQEEVNKASATQALTMEMQENLALQAQRIETARAELKRVEAERDAAELQLALTELRSPAYGIVARVLAHVGERVEEGQTIALVHDLDRLWLIANIEETQIRHILPGQVVDIRVDALPSRTFKGTVSHIGPVTKSQFALIPRQSRAGNFVKVVQRIPVYVSVDDADPSLKPGMSAVAAIQTSP